jgi:hypothetical protein
VHPQLELGLHRARETSPIDGAGDVGGSIRAHAEAGVHQPVREDDLPLHDAVGAQLAEPSVVVTDRRDDVMDVDVTSGVGFHELGAQGRGFAWPAPQQGSVRHILRHARIYRSVGPTVPRDEEVARWV